jgi:hypothetical protein
LFLFKSFDGEYSMAPPLGESLWKIGAEMGTAALLAEQGGFSYQSAGQRQVV